MRDEIVDLGPYAFQELSFDTVVDNCMPVWKRRYGFEVMATIERIELAPEIAGDLFRIVQEAVIGAGRHAQADMVSINLRRRRPAGGAARDRQRPWLRERRSLRHRRPGPFRLASMRERAELLDGELTSRPRSGNPECWWGCRCGGPRQAPAPAPTRHRDAFRKAIPCQRLEVLRAPPASRFTLTSPWLFAICQPPLWPHPCGSATVPGSARR